MLILPDATTLRRCADSADPPRVLVLATPMIAAAAQAGWPEWMGLGDFKDACAQADFIGAWPPDLVIFLCQEDAYDGDVPCPAPSPALLFRFPKVLVAGVAFERIVTPYRPLDSDSEHLARWLRDTCTALIARVFLPGMLCVDFADLAAVITVPGPSYVVMASIAASPDLLRDLSQLRDALVTSHFDIHSIYAVVTANHEYTIAECEMVAAATEFVFPAAIIAGPAVPSMQTGRQSGLPS